jgi:hypothetical protein
LQAGGLEPDGDDSKLFMEAYDDDTTTSNIRNAIKYLQTIGDNMLYEQVSSGKMGTAWLDDRTLPQTYPMHSSGDDSVHFDGNHSSSTTVNTFFSHSYFGRNIPTTNDGCEATDAAVSCPKIRRVTSRKGAHIQLQSHQTLAPRIYKAPLNASELYSHLREKQFCHATLQDADRRLIYIADPDPYDLLALIKTARPHQCRSLRNVISKYLSLDCTVKATIEEGYTEFHLEFHIPYFALRRSQTEQDVAKRTKRSHRGWMNLAFLDTDDDISEIKTVCGWRHRCFESYRFYLGVIGQIDQ